jgi:hypothetical protein
MVILARCTIAAYAVPGSGIELLHFAEFSCKAFFQVIS